MKSMTLGIGLLVGGLLAGSLALAQGGGHDRPTHTVGNESASQERKTEIKLQTTCPVMGGAIDKNLYVDHDGKRVYLCCKGCAAPVKKDPVKYIKALEDKGVTVASLQTTCPVMGGKVNKDLYVDHDGKRVYVCCEGCIAAVRKDPQTYIKKLADKGEVPAAVPPAAKENQDARDAHGGHAGHQQQGGLRPQSASA